MLRTTRVLWTLAALLTALPCGCSKYDGPQGKEPAAAPADTAPAQVQVAPPKKKQEPTFSEKAIALTQAITDGTKACVADFIDKMEMQKIDDGFMPVNANQMDKVCQKAIVLYKTDGVKLIGQRPVLDTFLGDTAAFGDVYRRMSFKLRQLGARERWKVVRDIERYRGEALDHAKKMAASATTIAAWPPDLRPATEVSTEAVDDATYQGRARVLARWLADRLPKLVSSYDRYGFQPAELQESILLFSFTYHYLAARRVFDLGEKQFEALSCTGKDCERTKKRMEPVLAAATAVFDAYAKGRTFYRGNYFKRIEKHIPLHKDLHDKLKVFQKALRKSHLG